MKNLCFRMGLFAAKCYLCKKKHNLMDVEISSKTFMFHPMCLIEYALSKLSEEEQPHCQQCKGELIWIKDETHLFFECNECNITYDTNYVNLDTLNLYGKEKKIEKHVQDVTTSNVLTNYDEPSKFSCHYCSRFFDRMKLWKSNRDSEKLICLECQRKFHDEKIQLDNELIESTLEEEKRIKHREKLDKRGRALPDGYDPNTSPEEKSTIPEINSKLNHSGENLSFQSFVGVDFTDADLTNANLKNTNFSNAILKNCNFTDADLTETDFTDADLTNAKFHNANLTGTKFARAKLWTEFDDGSTGIHVDINELLKSNLKEVDLPNLKIINFNLTKKNFTNANLSNANLINSDHSSTIFENANLEGIKLYSCDLKNVNFINANLKNSDLSYSDMTGADLTNAKIDGANFTNCNMINTILENIDKNKANFSGVTFETKILTEKEEVHVKIIEEIKKIKFNASVSFNSKDVIIHPNDPNAGEISFYIEPFKGTEHFATLISGGNFDFRDDDSSQYIISIKFKKINPKINDILVNKIRQGYPRKFKVFPSALSIGAYWMVDSVNEEFASEILQRILTSFVRDYFTQ